MSSEKPRLVSDSEFVQSDRRLDEQLENPKPRFSLLIFVLLFSIAAIGLSHVQTTYQLQELTEKHRQLELLNSKITEHDISAGLKQALEQTELKRIEDLVESSNEMLTENGIKEPFRKEIRSLLDGLGF